MHKMNPSCGSFSVNFKWKSTLETKLSAVFFKMSFQKNNVQINSSNPLYVFLRKGVLQICSKYSPVPPDVTVMIT